MPKFTNKLDDVESAKMENERINKEWDKAKDVNINDLMSNSHDKVKVTKNIYFTTNRCYVTLPSSDDYPYLCQLESDPEVMQFFGGARDREAVKQWMLKLLAHYEKHGLGYGLAFCKQTHELIGRCGLNKLEFNDNAKDVEIGYFIARKYWNQGYATELASGILTYAGDILKLDSTVATIDPENIASQKIVSKLGMQFIGSVPYMNKQQLSYSIKFENKCFLEKYT